MFDQMSSYIILMDLLYENQQYDHVLEVMEIVKDRQLNGIKFPMDCVTLAIAASYKIVSVVKCHLTLLLPSLDTLTYWVMLARWFVVFCMYHDSKRVNSSVVLLKFS